MATSSSDPNSLTVDEKIKLIERGLQEQLNPEIIHEVLRKNERSPVIYWGKYLFQYLRTLPNVSFAGTATTGRPHCGYFVPLLKLGEFLRAGCVVKILLADLHAVLDNLKAPFELVKFRAEYYRRTITASLKAINVPIDRIEFVLGTSYQLTKEYTLDFHRLSCLVTERNAKKATTQVLKEVSDPPVSGLNYPLMQALDEEYLGVDAQFGGVDQRKIFTLALEQLPKIGYRKRAHLMNPMVPGLQGGKMSSSEPDSKIDFLDPPDVVKKKMRKVPLVPRETENSGIFSFIQYVLLPASQLQRNETAEFAVEQGQGEFRIYNDIEALKDDYREDKVSHACDLPRTETESLPSKGLSKCSQDSRHDGFDITATAHSS